MKTLLVAIALLLPAAAPAATLSVIVDGARVHATTYGEASKTVVFVHGWTCDETSWSEQVTIFQKDYRVITIDLPGHGKSESPKNGALNMDLWARAIEAVRVEARANKITLVGHSMGAAVIMQYAVRYPDRVAGLVPVDGQLTPRSAPGGGDRMRGEQGLKTRENMIRGMVTTATPAIQARVMKMMMGTSEKTAAEAAEAMFTPAKTGGPYEFPGLGIYAGERSGTLAPLVPNSRVVGIPGTGHFLMLEKPAEFNKLLADFLAGVKF